MTVNNAHAYCDESGNTGANLLDPNQPLLVVGGWFVLDGFIKAAEQVVREYIDLLAPLNDEASIKTYKLLDQQTLWRDGGTIVLFGNGRHWRGAPKGLCIVDNLFGVYNRVNQKDFFSETVYHAG